MIQHPDINSKAADFKKQPCDTLLVRSHFPTIQGEGPLSGQPAVFLRLGGCNFGHKELFCQFCDTDFRISESEFLSFNYLYGLLVADGKEINKGRPWDKLLVITGGEPTLQTNLNGFICHMGNSGWRVQLETNGTHLHLLEDETHVHCAVVISPKASLKGDYWVPPKEQIPHIAAFKFVVSADLNNPHHKLPGWLEDPDVKGIPVYISPIAAYARPYSGEVANAWLPDLLDVSKTTANYSYAARVCMETGYRLSIQQHLFAALP